jgi:3-phosphoshikimate 1-carboxyvinyltransferase
LNAVATTHDSAGSATPMNPSPEAPAQIRAAIRLRGMIALPGDKSISHRALLLAAIADGESRIDGASDGADVRSTAGLLRALGVSVERSEAVTPLEQAGPAGPARTVTYIVRSPGAAGLREPEDVLDCGNSGTTLRLATGMLAGLPLTAILTGDASLRRRPVARIIEPLRSMGAVLHARRNDSLPPLTVVGHSPLRAITVTTAVPSAQTKSAILLAALRADGRTTVREGLPTRDHTERMLRARGVPVSSEKAAVDPATGVAWSIDGGVEVQAIDDRVPADVSAAAFWLVAGAIHPDAELHLPAVGVNPTRRAVIDLLRAMGAVIDETGGRTDDGVGEPTADLRVRTSELRGIDLGPADVAGAIDEIPALCLAATQARGTTRIRGAGELRNKESDRIAGIAHGLAALGADVAVDGDDLTIVGPTALRGAPADSLGDHRLAMTFAIAGLVASGTTTINEPASAGISYPGFFDEIERIRA